MTLKTIVSIGCALFLLVCAGQAFCESSDPDVRKGRRHHTPPPEAFTVCEDKQEGDRAEFVTPRGDTVTGACVEMNGRLFLRPDHPPEGKPCRDKQRAGEEE